MQSGLMKQITHTFHVGTMKTKMAAKFNFAIENGFSGNF
jgi:hypothetical protein